MKRISKYSELDDEGELHFDYSAEFPDGTPVEVPLRFSRPPTLEERMKMFIRSQRMQEVAQAAGMESFQEADDFEIDDPDEALTPYELSQLMEHAPVMRQEQNADVASPPGPIAEQVLAGQPKAGQGAPAGTPAENSAPT